MDIDWGCEKSVCPRDQQMFQVVKGDRKHIITQLAVYIYHVYIYIYRG